MSATRCKSSPEPQCSDRTALSLPGALRSSLRKRRTFRFCVVKNGAKINAVYRQTGKQLPRCWVFLCQSLPHTKVLAKRCSTDFSPKSDQPLLGPTRSKEGVCPVSCHGLSRSSGDVGVHGRHPKGPSAVTLHENSGNKVRSQRPGRGETDRNPF